MFKLTPLLVLLWGAGCTPNRSDGVSMDLKVTELFREGKKLAEVKDDKLEELSGLSASRINSGLLWTHNDSGNDPEVFLINEKLDIKQTIELEGVNNRDWEDIAVGPGPVEGQSYLYIAEIGDNNAIYPLKYIYRLPEPRRKKGDKKISISDFDVITFQLADGAKDAEALMINPLTLDLYIVSKREDPVHLYRLPYPYSTTDTLVAESVATLDLTQIVAGDISSDGKEVLLKNYDHIYYWPNEKGLAIPDLLQQPPLEIPYDVEPQGESIAWADDESGFYTVSERNKGKKSYLYFYKRR